MTDEEKAELNAEMNKEDRVQTNGQPEKKADLNHISTSRPLPAAAQTRSTEQPVTSPITASSPHSTIGTDIHPHQPSQTPATPPSAAKSSKLSPEQKVQMQALDLQREKERVERVQTLAKKLKERCRPFETATNPGDINGVLFFLINLLIIGFNGSPICQTDSETKAFEKRIRTEANDMKLESFGVELCHLIGQSVRNSFSFGKFRILWI